MLYMVEIIWFAISIKVIIKFFYNLLFDFVKNFVIFFFYINSIREKY